MKNLSRPLNPGRRVSSRTTFLGPDDHHKWLINGPDQDGTLAVRFLPPHGKKLSPLTPGARGSGAGIPPPSGHVARSGASPTRVSAWFDAWTRVLIRGGPQDACHPLEGDPHL